MNEAVADALNETEKRLETNLGTSIQKIEDQQGHLIAALNCINERLDAIQKSS